MKNDFLKRIETFLTKRKKRRVAQGTAAVLAVVMAVITTNAMILPAISLEKSEAEKDAAIFLEEKETDSNAKPKKSRKATDSNAVVIADWPESVTSSNAVIASSSNTVIASSSNAQVYERIYRDDEIEIIATYSNAAKIPEEAEFVVEKLEPGEFPEETEKMTGDEYEKLKAEKEDDEDNGESKGIKKTLEEVEAFIKSLLNLEKEEADSEETTSSAAAETEEETLESIRLNMEDEETGTEGNETTADAMETDGESQDEPEESAEPDNEELADEDPEEGDPTDEEPADGQPTLRYKIGFFVDEIEIEPQDTVSISVRFFAEEFAAAEEIEMTHYLDNSEEGKTEVLKTKAEVDEEGAVKAVFDMDSFSVMEFGLTYGAAEITKTFYITVGQTFDGKDNELSWQQSGYVTVKVKSGAEIVDAQPYIYSEGTGKKKTYYSSLLVTGNQKGNAIIQVTNQANESFTYEFIVMAPGEIRISYDVDGEFERAGSDFTDPADQSWYTDAYVVGLDGEYDTVTGETYTVRNISNETRVASASYWYGGGKGLQLFTYHFIGWQRSDNNEIILADSIGTPEGIINTLEISEPSIELKAIWCVHFDHNDESDNNLDTVGFFIAIVDKVGEFVPSYDSWYTDCLYTTRVEEGAEWAAAHGSDPIWGDSSGEGYEDADKKIRESAETGIQNGEYRFRLKRMPSDDEIFARIRSWEERIGEGVTPPQIVIEEKTYEPTDINADNFEIKWFVVKNQHQNGWHIDGLLIPKKAKLTITKTFVGDSEAIEKISDNYKIVVTETSGTDKKSPYILPLKPKSESEPNGYCAVEGNTYTWVLENLLQVKKYTVKEENYDVDGFVTTVNYQISQAKDSENNTVGWVSYNKGEGITVPQCYSYQNNLYRSYQTVSLRNVYTKPYILTLIKQDGTTYHGLSNVVFNLTLFRDGGERIKDNEKLTSDSSGNIVIDFSAAGTGSYTFTLDEQPNDGYNQASVQIRGNVDVDAEGKVTVSNLVVKVSGDDTTASIDEENPSVIYIVNHSEKAEITVEKKWTDGTNKPVTIQLLRNGADTGEPVELSEGNKWTHSWTDQPYYVDGKIAEYSVRETWIGTPGEGAAYSSEDDADGYSEYIVTQSKTVDKANRKTHIIVQNAKDNGQAVFTKVNSSDVGLPGAQFTVYSNENCTEPVKIDEKDAVFTSDKQGTVTIVGLSKGKYYIKETLPPDGYAISDTVYVLNVKDYNSTITTKTGDKVTKIVNEEVKAKLSIKKVTDAEGGEIGLKGAHFLLFTEDNYKKYMNGAETPVNIGEWTSDGGEKTFSDGFSVGKYYLVEISAPDGYNLLPGSVEITVTGKGEVKAEIKEADSANQPTCIASDDDPYSYTITVKNIPGRQLPSTGGIGTTFNKFGGLLLMAGAVICGYILKRRREGRAVK